MTLITGQNSIDRTRDTSQVLRKGRYRNVARVASGGKPLLYLAIFFASALNLAQRFFVAFPIFALTAAESTRLVPFLTFLSADRP